MSNSVEYFIKFYGNNYNQGYSPDHCSWHRLLDTGDGYYILSAGGSVSNMSILCIRLDNNGNVVWSRKLYASGAQQPLSGKISGASVSDDGHVVIPVSVMESSVYNGIHLFMLSKMDGSILRRVRFSYFIGSPSVFSGVVGASDGDYFITFSDGQYDSSRTWAIGKFHTADMFDNVNAYFRRVIDSDTIAGTDAYNHGCQLETVPYLGTPTKQFRTWVWAGFYTDIFALDADASSVLWVKRMSTAIPNTFMSFRQSINSDGSHFVCARAHSALAGGARPFLIKLDSSGNLLWARYYGAGDGHMLAAAEDPDGNICCAARIYDGSSNRAVIMKLDSSGEVLPGWPIYIRIDGSYGSNFSDVYSWESADITVRSDSIAVLWNGRQTGASSTDAALFKISHDGDFIQSCSPFLPCVCGSTLATSDISVADKTVTLSEW